MKRTGIFTFIVLLCLSALGTAQEKLLPSKAYDLISAETAAKLKQLGDNRQENSYKTIRKQLSLEYLPRVIQTDLNEKEKGSLAKIFAGAEKTAEALKLSRHVIFSESRMRTDVARFIFQAMDDDSNIGVEEMQMLLEEIKKAWAKDPRTLATCQRLEANIFSKMVKKDRAQEALDIVNSKLAQVKDDAPQNAWDLVRNYLYLHDALSKPEQGEKITLEYADRLNTIADRREKEQPANADKDYITKTGHLRLHAQIFKANVRSRHILGDQAPEIEFTHFFNSKPFSFADLKGNVVVLDFWATWCGPCITTFPHMREFYAEYKDKGVIVLGVTGLQGAVANHGREAATNLTEEQELALMPEFINYQKITWPIVFSTRGCDDVEYGVRGIPTLIIIDKKGVVRLSTHPARQEEIKKMVDKLLSER